MVRHFHVRHFQSTHIYIYIVIYNQGGIWGRSQWGGSNTCGLPHPSLSPYPPLPLSIPLHPFLTPYPFPSPTTSPLPFPNPLPSPCPYPFLPFFAARGLAGGALKLPQRVRAEPGRQTFSGAFWAENPASLEFVFNMPASSYKWTSGTGEARWGPRATESLAQP